MVTSSNSRGGPLLDSAQTATLLGVGRQTVARWTEGGKLAALRAPDGRRRYERAAVLALMVDIKLSEKGLARRRARAGDRRSREAAEAALDVDLTRRAAVTAQALATEAAADARRSRASAGREAAEQVADRAAQDVVAARFRADAMAARIRAAADRAADAERSWPQDTDILARAARTAAIVDAAAAAVELETVKLATMVADSVAAAAQLVATSMLILERAIANEVALAAAAIELRAVATAHLAAADVDYRLNGPAALN